MPPDRAAATDAPVGQARGFDLVRFVQVAPVEHHRIAQFRLQQGEVRAAELLPLGDDDERGVNSVLRRLNVWIDATPLAALNLPEPNWFNDPDWAIPSLIIMMLWATGGGAMIIFLAGLQGIPQHLYEAAELDGAGRWRQFLNVTLPMLTPTIFFNLIMGIIGALQVFMQAFVLVGQDGGFDNQLLFFVLYLYRKAFIDYEFGYAAALAWILFAIILAFTLLIIRSSALWVYYEGERQ